MTNLEKDLVKVMKKRIAFLRSWLSPCKTSEKI